MWTSKLKEELDKINIKKKSNNLLEIPVRKNIIRDLYSQQNSSKNILIIKNDILNDIENENYFEFKNKKNIKNKKINNINNNNINIINKDNNIVNNANKSSKEIKQYNLEDFLNN